MKYPNLNEEKKLWKNGFDFVIGLDEAGRGPLAGPVVAGAVFINPGIGKRIAILKKINDSKLLSEKKRKEIYAALINHPEINWGVGAVGEKTIDRVNILEATKLAMKKAIVNLISKSNFQQNQNIFLLLDGNFKIKTDFSQKSIIKGDQKVISVAMASIIAKVYRDNLMIKYHKKFPQYGFEKHKGYGTAHHYAMLKEYGPSVIHRQTFNLYF